MKCKIRQNISSTELIYKITSGWIVYFDAAHKLLLLLCLLHIRYLATFEVYSKCHHN